METNNTSSTSRTPPPPAHGTKRKKKPVDTATAKKKPPSQADESIPVSSTPSVVNDSPMQADQEKCQTPQENGSDKPYNKEWKHKLELSPPVLKNSSLSATDAQQHLSIAEVELRMQQDDMDDYLLSSEIEDVTLDQKKIIYYLYGSGFDWDTGTLDQAGKERRKGRMQQFLERDAMQRMMAILNIDDSKRTPNRLDLWRKTQLAVLLYASQQGAHTIFDKNKKIPVLARIQGSKNCYLHATAAVVEYKIAHCQENNNYRATTIDIAKLVRRTYVGEELYRRVVGNKGGNSKSLLKQLEANMDGLTSGETFLDEELVSGMVRLLKKHGPALVHRFRTDGFFKQKSALTPSQPETTNSIWIHQFDRTNDKDRHTFLELKNSTPEEHEKTIREIERANSRPPSEKDCRVLVVSSHSSSGDGSCPTPEPVSSDSGSKTESTRADYDGEEGGKVGCVTHGRHAMVLVGSRQELDASGTPNKKVWFLLQNTWERMPLLEVSAEYLAHHLRPVVSTGKGQMKHRGTLVFLEGTASGVPNALVDDMKQQNLQMECSYDDFGDEEEAEPEPDTDED